MNNFKNCNTALIGCGYWGTNIAKVLNVIKRDKIVIFDTNISNAKTLQKRFTNKFLISKNLEKLIKSKEINNVILATPPEKNLNLIKLCIKFKKNIFVEKPGLRSFNEINKISKLKNSKVLMFGYIYLFNNYIKFIKKFINNKKNGKLLYLSFQRQNLGPIRNDVNASYDLSSHDLSIILNLFNKVPKKIKNNSYSILKKNISDISNLNFSINNIFFNINNSWLNPEKIRKITIITSKKMLLFNEMDPMNKIKIFNKYAEYPKISQFDSSYFKKKAKIYQGKNFIPKIKSNDPLKDELLHFFKCIKDKKKPIPDITFAKKILKVLNNIN